MSRDSDASNTEAFSKYIAQFNFLEAIAQYLSNRPISPWSNIFYHVYPRDQSRGQRPSVSNQHPIYQPSRQSIAQQAYNVNRKLSDSG